MAKRYNAVIVKEGSRYVARCLEVGVTSQGRTIEEAQHNLREAVELYIESFADDLPDGSQEVLFYPLEVAISA